MHTITTISKYILQVGGIVIMMVIVNALIISRWTHRHISYTVSTVTPHTIGLVFGTSDSTQAGTANIFFTERIRTVVQLYMEGIIDYILVSGDNTTPYYDEPTTFKQALINQGVSPDDIVLDYAGINTRDSVARAKQIFQVDEILLISQQFQVERGLVACRYHQMNCAGFATRPVPWYVAPRIYLRELGSRIKLRYRFLLPNPSIGGAEESVPW